MEKKRLRLTSGTVLYPFGAQKCREHSENCRRMGWCEFRLYVNSWFNWIMLGKLVNNSRKTNSVNDFFFWITRSCAPHRLSLGVSRLSWRIIFAHFSLSLFVCRILSRSLSCYTFVVHHTFLLRHVYMLLRLLLFLSIQWFFFRVAILWARQLYH